MQAALGGFVGIGGEYVGNQSSNNYVFGFTGSPGDVRQLEITTAAVSTPEPSSLLIFGGLAGLMATRLRRKKAA